MSFPQCVLCKLQLINTEEHLYECPKCNRQYISDYEIMEYNDSIGTAHDDEAATIELEGIGSISGPRLEIKKDELDFKPEMPSLELERERNKTKTDIKIPKYMKDSDTTKVTDFEQR